MTCFCVWAAFWFLVWRTIFQSWLSVKKSSSIDPERPEKAITSALMSSPNFRRLHRVVFSSQQCRYWGSKNDSKWSFQIQAILKSYLVHFGSFNLHILYFHASVVEKFEVIAEKCPKPYLLLSVLLLTDQMWRLISSSGLHFCLKHSPVNDLPLPDSS